MSTPPVTPPTPTPAPAPTETLGQAVEQVVSDVQSDITATQGAVTGAIDPLWAQARAEYDALEPAAQGRIHSLLNDLETAYGLALPALHTAFGAKK